MADLDTSTPDKPKGLLSRLLRFLGIGYCAEDEQERARLAALDLDTAVYADLFGDESDEILVLTSDFGLEMGTIRINAAIGGGKKQFQGKSCPILGYVHVKSGMLTDEPIYILTWAEDDTNNPFKNCSFQTLKPLTIYRTRSKLGMDWEPFGSNWLSNMLLVEVLEIDAHNQELENLRQKYLNPVVYTHPPATFRLDTFMGTFEASSKWAGLPVKLSLNADGKKPASRALKRLTEAFAQQVQLYSTLNAYLLEHICKHNGIRTKNEFFANPHPTAESFLQDLKPKALNFVDQNLYIVFHNDDDALIPDDEYYFYVSFDTKGNITGITS